MCVEKKKQMAKYFAVIWHGGDADARLCSDLFQLFAISIWLKRPDKSSYGTVSYV